MSLSKNIEQAKRWLQTAEEDLHAAQILLDAALYAQSCFYAQQSAEKALKALWYAADANPWGHSVQRLAAELPQAGEIADHQNWIEHGALLDKFYIPTRYPNGLPDLTPGQVYRLNDAQQGLNAAHALVAGCRQWLDRYTQKPMNI